jgi:hypothetical protein
MVTGMRKWVVPGVGFAIGLLVAAAELGRQATLLEALVAFAVVAAYALALVALQSRSETASLLSGLPVDERWESINGRALSLAAQVIALMILIAFLASQFSGGDAMPYAWLGAVFATAYLGGILWYRWRQ